MGKALGEEQAATTVLGFGSFAEDSRKMRNSASAIAELPRPSHRFAASQSREPLDAPSLLRSRRATCEQRRENRYSARSTASGTRQRE
jgi:hypothetical protein